MKEKILGVLLALSPFSKGEAQEAKITGEDKVAPKIEQTQEKPAVSKLLKDKKTANPWKISLETNVSLVNRKETSNPEEHNQELKMEQKQRVMTSIAGDVFKNSVLTNIWFKDINKLEDGGDLGTFTPFWEEYKQGKINAVEASMRLSDVWELNNKSPKIWLDNNFATAKISKVNISAQTLILLANYFSQIGILELYKSSANDFSRGSVFMGEVLSSIKAENLSVDGLAQAIKNRAKDLSYEEKIGALTFFSVALNENSNFGEETSVEKNADQAVLNDLVAKAVQYLQGDIAKPEEGLGVCRHLAAVISGLAKNGLDLNASEVTTDRHIITQIKGPNGEITLLDGGNFVNTLEGRPLLTKNDVDAALIKNFKKPTIGDLTAEAGGDKILYENRYNNFAGLMNEVTNRKNMGRAAGFIAGSDQLELFPSFSEAGITRGSIEKGNIGLEAYWLRDNNEYSSFMKDMKGLNLAAYVPADFSLGKKKFENIFFANLGFYRSVLDLAVDRGGETKTLDATMSLENYLKCSLNTSLTAGMIAKLADFNLELYRTGNQLSRTEKFEWHGSVSPFISFEVPGGDKKAGENSRTYLCSGLEITDYLALPDSKKLSTIPWFQAGFEFNKKEIDLGLKLRGEFQPASSRFDFDSFLKKGNNQLELKTYLELYNQKFKELTPYKNVAGIEAGISHDLKNGQNLFVKFSVKSDGGTVKQILVNLGYKF